MDPYYDLAVVFMENNKKEEALAVLQEGREKSQDFIDKSQELYDRLCCQKFQQPQFRQDEKY